MADDMFSVVRISCFYRLIKTHFLKQPLMVS